MFINISLSNCAKNLIWTQKSQEHILLLCLPRCKTVVEIHTLYNFQASEIWHFKLIFNLSYYLIDKIKILKLVKFNLFCLNNHRSDKIFIKTNLIHIFRNLKQRNYMLPITAIFYTCSRILALQENKMMKLL